MAAAASDNSIDWSSLKFGTAFNCAVNLWSDGPKIKILEEGLKAHNTSIARVGEGNDDGASVPPNHDVLSYVLDYLGPRELYNMSNTCKYVRAKITLPMVIKCGTVSQNGNIRKTMANMLELMMNRSIWIPSPLRLLRLMNGRRCEFCNKKRSTFMRKIWGVFACGDCLGQSEERKMILREGKVVHEWNWACNVFGNYNSSKERGKVMSPIFRHPRITNVIEEKSIERVKMWGFNKSDASGEKIGPLVTLCHFINICQYVVEKKTFLAVDRYIEKLQPPTTQEYDEYVTVAKNAIAQAKRYQDQRNMKKELARIARNKKIGDKATKLIRDILAKLPPGKRRLLSHIRKDVNAAWKEDCIYFENDEVRDLLRPHIRSATKMTKLKLEELILVVRDIQYTGREFGEFFCSGKLL